MRNYIDIYPLTKPSMWQTLIDYINDNRERTFIGFGTITRKELIHRLECDGYFRKNSVKSMDTYRNYLYQAGYLVYFLKENLNKKRGHYRILKEIPHDLSVDECRNKAYGVIQRGIIESDRFVRAMSDRFEHRFEHIKVKVHIKKDFISKEEMEI